MAEYLPGCLLLVATVVMVERRQDVLGTDRGLRVLLCTALRWGMAILATARRRQGMAPLHLAMAAHPVTAPRLAMVAARHAPATECRVHQVMAHRRELCRAKNEEDTAWDLLLESQRRSKAEVAAVAAVATDAGEDLSRRCCRHIMWAAIALL